MSFCREKTPSIQALQSNTEKKKEMMTKSNTACLDDLVPDVLYLILVNTFSVQMLWNFIRSSPRILEVFCTHRDTILSIAIAREVGNELLGNAHCALQTSRFVHRGGLSKLEVQEWITTYRADLENQASHSSIPSISDALPLWRIHRDVKFLANIYVREILPIVTHQLAISKE